MEAVATDRETGMIQPIDDYKIISFYHEAKKLIKGEMVMPRLLSVWLTNYCNLKCSGCWYFNKNEITDRKSMDVIAYKKLIDEVAGAGVESIELSVAESTLHPDFGEMALYAKNKGLSVSVITNGTVLNQKYLEKIGVGIKTFSFIRISLDYSNPKSYLAGKGADLFERVIENTKTLLDMRGIDVSPRIGLKFILNTKNLTEINEMVLLSESIGVDYAQFNLEHSSIDVIDDRQARYAETLIKALRKKAGMQIYSKLKKLSCNIKCFMSPIHAIIDCRGDVYICCNFNDNRGLIGNVFENNFKDVWFSARHKEVIESIMPQMCEQASGGGCRWFFYNGIMDKVIRGHEGDLEFI